MPCFARLQVTMADRAAAERACKDPNPIIDGRKANVNLAYLGAKPRGNLTSGKFLSPIPPPTPHHQQLNTLHGHVKPSFTPVKSPYTIYTLKGINCLHAVL